MRTAAPSPPSRAPSRPWMVPWSRRGVRTEQLRGADEGGCALELLGGQEAECVSHEDGDTVTAVEGAVAALDGPLEPPDRERECRQTEIGLRLAATGGEEEKFD